MDVKRRSHSRASCDDKRLVWFGEADGENFLEACKNYIKEHQYGEIRVLEDGTEVAQEWGCRWFPTLEEASKLCG